MKEYIFKRIKDTCLKEYKICVIFEVNSFEIILFQPSNAWRADLSQDALSILASQLKMNLEEYYFRIKGYLSDTPEDMSFKVTDNEFILHHTLKNNIKMNLFFCPLQKVNYCHYVEKLLDIFYEGGNEFKKKYDFAIKDEGELKQDNEVLGKKLQDFVTRKQSDDEVLYSNFVLVLNEKKRQIQHLTQTLLAFKRGRPIQNPPVEHKNKNEVEVKEEIVTEKNDISDSDTDVETTNYNTDDDQHTADIDNVPSTSKQNFNLFLDDSPPNRILPKRQKIAQSVIQPDPSSFSIVVPSGKKQESLTMNGKVENYFNTQDLLDLL